MKISIILGHPQKESFNHAIAETAAHALRLNGHEVYYHDLYGERFEPILSFEEIPKGASLDPVIEAHCKEIAEADGIIIVHPNWWGQPPAILKGWVDRVIRAGVAYGFEEGDDGEGVPIGLLKASMAIVLNTSNTPANREQNIFGDPLETLWKSCIFDLCGVHNFYRKMYGVIATSTEEERHSWLRDIQEIMERYFPNANGEKWLITRVERDA